MKPIRLLLLLLNALMLHSCYSPVKETGKKDSIKEDSFSQEESKGNVEEKVPFLLSPSKYVQYIDNEKNGFVLNKEYGEMLYKIQLTFPEYEAIKALGLKGCNKNNWEEALSDKSNNVYLNLKVSRKDGQDAMKSFIKKGYDKEKIASYFHFEFQKEVEIIMGGDSKECSIYFYQPSQGILPFHEFVFVFPGDAKTIKDLKVKFNKCPLFDGPKEFVFHSKQISNIPQVALN